MIIGIFAHVDSGKTTLSESILYFTNTTRNLGSVDDKTSILDSDELERRQKITIFSSVIDFTYNEHKYYLIDTPGHLDFINESEASILAVDVVILLVALNKKISDSERRLFKLAKALNKKIIIVITKMDLVNNSLEKRIKEIESFANIIDTTSQEFLLELSLYHDEVDETNYKTIFKKMIEQDEVVPLLKLSALKNDGVDNLLHFLDEYYYTSKKSGPFNGLVFKKEWIKGELYSYIKVLSGTLKVKEEIKLIEEQEEVKKISNIFEINKSLKQVSSSDEEIILLKNINPKLFSYIGFKTGILDNILTESLFRVPLKINSKMSLSEAYNILSKFALCDEMLKVNTTKDMITLDITGELKKKIVKEKVLNLGLDFDYLLDQVILKETVSSEVIGYGHYEPLRHYAEVKIMLSPSEETTFENKTGENNQFTNLVRHYCLDYKHYGVLTGSELINVKYTLLGVATHEKHTEGGDLFEATRRAIRQAQTNNNNDILEPFYHVILTLENSKANTVIKDLKEKQIKVEVDVLMDTTLNFKISARDLMEYYPKLIALTSNNFTLTKEYLGYLKSSEPCLLMANTNYDFESDLDNPTDSIFCAKGAGFLVKWYDIDKYHHLD